MVKELLRARRLAGRAGMDGKRMDRAGQFVRKHFVYQAVAVDPAFALESVRHNKNTKVGFTFRPVPYMAGMQM